MTQPLPVLPPSDKAALDTLSEDKLGEQTVPSIFWAATNAKETIYENQAGYKLMGDASSGKVDRESTLELYSMTKFVTCLAVLQFVECGTLDLDDPNQMYQHLPELAELTVLDGYDENDNPILVPQTSRITLRSLMDHTSGAVHFPTNAALAKWYQAHLETPWIFSPQASIKSLIAPLIFQPGTSWAFSSGTDWIGILISRLSGLTLEGYFQQHIFARVEGGMPDTSLYPRRDIVERRVGTYIRQEDGSLKLTKIFADRAETPEDVSKEFLCGAAGLYGTVKDYLSLCRAVLQCDPRNAYPPARPLLRPETFELVFRPSLTVEKARREAGTFFRRLNHLFFQPEPNEDNTNHSVALSLITQDGEHGRRAGSGGWSGLANTHFWIDPTTGLAGVCGTQIVDTGPDPWHKIYQDFERTLYESLVV